MSKISYYNRLDRTPLDIAKLFINDELSETESGVILVRESSDGTQPTYDVRHYANKSDKPSFFNGRLYKVEELRRSKQ